MLLEKFNDYPKLIDVRLDREPIQYTYIDEKGGEKIVGIGDTINGELVCFYTISGKLIFRCRNVEVDLNSSGISLSFRQSDNGTSEFKVHNRGGVFISLEYDSWWKEKPAATPAGFGTSGGEEEDFLAYLTLMSKSESRINHLLDKYS